jgi:hypothetical protein
MRIFSISEGVFIVTGMIKVFRCGRIVSECRHFTKPFHVWFFIQTHENIVVMMALWYKAARSPT